MIDYDNPIAASDNKRGRTLPASREQLWGLLDEAAEIEHTLMCCYLYAFFSLKESVDEDVTPDELAAISRWRGEILDIAIEEMGHLAIVSNILSSLGAPAHFGRQNFPIPAGYHPAGVVVKLAPFNVETLDHFVFLERPETVELADGTGFAPVHNYVRSLKADRLMSATMDYATVGQLYAAIEGGIRKLAAEFGDDRLFVGDSAHQIGPDVIAMSNLKVVRCASSACEAIDAIVRQGEGSDPDEAGSHYQRFLAIREEYRSLLAARPDFHPGRPATHNPVMRRPPDPEGKLWIDAEPAAALLDLGNALYNHCLRCLALAYGGVDVASRRALVEAGIALMRLLTPVASRLTALPASTSEVRCTAGLSFATLRSSAMLPAEPGGVAAIVERLAQIAAHSRGLSEADPALAELLDPLVRGVEGIIERLRAVVPTSNELDAEDPVAPVASPDAPPVADASTGPEVVAGEALDLVFTATRCIHARHCVLGAPEVFKANVEGAWIFPDATSTEDLVTIAHMCPSGAVQYRRKDGGDDERPPPVNLVQLRENGALGVRADIVLDGTAPGYRATLCRCGASKNKPFCDGSHVAVSFQASGEPATRQSSPLAERGGRLSIALEKDGPLHVVGNLEICAGTGRTIDRVETARLCRCGGSANKPFCDGTHRKIGFKSE